jgi:hypothetical protein
VCAKTVDLENVCMHSTTKMEHCLHVSIALYLRREIILYYYHYPLGIEPITIEFRPSMI